MWRTSSAGPQDHGRVGEGLDPNAVIGCGEEMGLELRRGKNGRNSVVEDEGIGSTEVVMVSLIKRRAQAFLSPG